MSAKQEYFWAQLYIGNKPDGSAFTVETSRNNVDAIANAVWKFKEKALLKISNALDASHLEVYRPGTKIPIENTEPLLRGTPFDPSNTTSEQPLIVIAEPNEETNGM